MDSWDRAPDCHLYRVSSYIAPATTMHTQRRGDVRGASVQKAFQLSLHAIIGREIEIELPCIPIRLFLDRSKQVLFAVIVEEWKAEGLLGFGVVEELVVEVEDVVRFPQNVHFHGCLPCELSAAIKILELTEGSAIHRQRKSGENFYVLQDSFH